MPNMSKKIYKVDKVKQLIDLNGDSTNFELTFKVTSENKQPFDMAILDQTTLDSNPSIEYKNINDGIVSGTMKQDKNVYQNFFMILKADNPCNCEVEIQKKELPKVAPPPPPPVKETSDYSWTTIGICVVIFLIICFGCYWWYTKANTAPMIAALPSGILSHRSPPTRYYESSAPSRHASPDNPLLQRLKNLNVT